MSLGELYNFAFTKAFKSSTPQISETKHFRLPVILLREQVLYLTKAGKNSLFLSMRSTSVKYFFLTQLFVRSLVKMEGRAVNRISVLARLDMEVKLATSVSKL